MEEIYVCILKESLQCKYISSPAAALRNNIYIWKKNLNANLLLLLSKTKVVNAETIIPYI